MGNPFASSVTVAAKGLVNDPTLRILHRNIPSHHPSCYLYPPANLILLPYINTSLLERDDQRTYTANLYHELRHHALSFVDVALKSQENILLKDLTNAIEDARIEICDRYVLEGGKQDLTEDNIANVKEYNEKYSKNQLKNRWGWLITKICLDIPQYGELILHEELQPYWDIAKEILTDGRFKKACMMEREGHATSLILAKEIIEKWQTKRNEEVEEDREKNKEKEENERGKSEIEKNEKDNKEGQDYGSGNNQSKPSGLSKSHDRSKNGNDSQSQSECGNGDGIPHQGSTGASTESSPSSIHGSNDHCDMGDESNAGKTTKRPKSKRSRKTSKYRDIDQDGRGEYVENGKESGGISSFETNSNRDTDPPPNGEKTGNKKEEKGDKESSETKEKPGEEILEEYSESKEELSEESEEIERDSNGRPIDIIKEYALGKKDSEFDLEGRNLKVAKMGAEGDIKDFQGKWWADKENFKNKKSIKFNFDGNILIPYNHEDREIVPKENKDGYLKIEDKIKIKIHVLQQELVKILRYLAHDKSEFCQKRGDIDEGALYKIISGSKYFRKRTVKKQDIGAAVTLLIDLSGSMAGEKAILAAQIATSFGEALVNIPEVSFEIRGYNSSPLLDGNFVYSYQKDNQNVSIRSESVNHWIFKRFHEDWKTVRYRMGSCLQMGFDHKNPTDGGCIGGCNCDHENLIVAAHHLWEQKAKRKLLIVLCDGIPSGYNGTYSGLLEKELHKVVEKIKKSGIDLFCYGIMDHQVEKFYKPEVEVVDSLNDLNEKTMNKLANYLLSTVKRKPHNVFA